DPRLLFVPVPSHARFRAGQLDVAEVALVHCPRDGKLAKLVLRPAATTAANAATGADRLAVARLHVASGHAPDDHTATRIPPTTMPRPATLARPCPCRQFFSARISAASAAIQGRFINPATVS